MSCGGRLPEGINTGQSLSYDRAVSLVTGSCEYCQGDGGTIRVDILETLKHADDNSTGVVYRVEYF